MFGVTRSSAGSWLVANVGQHHCANSRGPGLHPGTELIQPQALRNQATYDCGPFAATVTPASSTAMISVSALTLPGMNRLLG